MKTWEMIKELTLTIEDCLKIQRLGYSVAFSGGGDKICIEKEKSQ